MIKQCNQLLIIQMLTFFGINEARYSKDKNKKAHLIMLAVCFVLVGAVLAIYVGIIAYSLCYIGVAQIVPAYILAITSLITIFFTIFRANGVIFQPKNYDALIALPIHPGSIVASRFLSMYVGNLLLAILTMVPSGVVYGQFVPLNVTFYFMFFLSIFVIPLIPMTIATTFGAIITAISARMKHKNIVTISFSLLLTLGIMGASFQTSELNMNDLGNISTSLSRKVNSMYFLSELYTDGMVKQNWISFLIFFLLSLVFFLLFVVIVAWKFISICSALQSHVAKKIIC